MREYPVTVSTLYLGGWDCDDDHIPVMMSIFLLWRLSHTGVIKPNSLDDAILFPPFKVWRSYKKCEIVALSATVLFPPIVWKINEIWWNLVKAVWLPTWLLSICFVISHSCRLKTYFLAVSSTLEIRSRSVWQMHSRGYASDTCCQSAAPWTL